MIPDRHHSRSHFPLRLRNISITNLKHLHQRTLVLVHVILDLPSPASQVNETFTLKSRSRVRALSGTPVAHLLSSRGILLFSSVSYGQRQSVELEQRPKPKPARTWSGNGPRCLGGGCNFYYGVLGRPLAIEVIENMEQWIQGGLLAQHWTTET